MRWGLSGETIRIINGRATALICSLGLVNISGYQTTIERQKLDRASGLGKKCLVGPDEVKIHGFQDYSGRSAKITAGREPSKKFTVPQENKRNDPRGSSLPKRG